MQQPGVRRTGRAAPPPPLGVRRACPSSAGPARRRWPAGRTMPIRREGTITA